MKIDIGKNYNAYLNRIQNWHPYFAWVPRRVSDHCWIWLETIERKGTIMYGYESFPPIVWDYREKMVDKENGIE